MAEWTPRDYTLLVTTGTACLCLVILVLGAVIGVINGKISVAELGQLQTAGVGGGLLGFAYIVYLIIKTTIGKD